MQPRRPNRRSWERRHRISELLREAMMLAREESLHDHEDRHAITFTSRIGLLYEDAKELEEKALERQKPRVDDRRPEGMP